ncbi:uncharacterized protein [Penaeus vannamei]|uniref:uncharacterized protein isoform X1 n=1 Tax=Penaeus vannamei TaxID=6689 RepID=UPI00387F40CA
MILELVTLALTIFPRGKVVFGQESCVDGCPTIRLLGLMVPLEDEPHGIGAWPRDGEVTVSGPGFNWKGERLAGAPGRWHDITTTSGPPYCVTAPTLRETRSCGPDQYLEVKTDHPSSWRLDCDRSSCGCHTERLIALRVPVDETVKIYWWPGETSSARTIGPGLWKTLAVDEGARSQWHDIRVLPPLGGKKCGLVSDSLGKRFACGQVSNETSSIYIQSSIATGWAPSYWAFGCTEAPRAPPQPKATFKTPRPDTPSRETPRPDTPSQETPRPESTPPPTVIHQPVPVPLTEEPVTECSGFRASGLMVPLEDAPHTLKWRPENNASLTLRGPGLPWVGEKLSASRDTWHGIFTTGSRPKYCVSVPTLRAAKSCGPEQYLEVKAEGPASWQLDCANSSCGCYTQRLISLRLPLGESSRLSWWPGQATSLRVIAPGVWKMLELDESARYRWHDITVQPEYNGTSCSLSSTSLGKTLACNLEVTSSSTIYVQGSDSNGWTPSYWSFGCAGVPQECLRTP